MRIAILGGSGKIGTFVVRRAAEAGHEVLNLDVRRPASDAPGTFYYTDVRRRDTLEPRLQDFGAEAVLHLAELPGTWGRPPEEVYAHNAAVSSNVFYTCGQLAQAGIVKSLVYASTCQVYGQWGENDPRLVPKSLPLTEESEPRRPLNAYAAAKSAAEDVALIVARRHPVGVCVLRLPVTSDFADARVDGWPFVSGRGSRRSGRSPWFIQDLRAYLDSRDAADAFLLAADRFASRRAGHVPEGVERDAEGNPVGGVFDVMHIAADDPMPPYHIPIADRIRETWDVDMPVPPDWPPHRSLVDSSKAKRVLGWSPGVSLLRLWQEAGSPVPAE